MGGFSMTGLVERAKALAIRAHAGQLDKAGRPYIEHVARVASAVEQYSDQEIQAVAWLHDVLEDRPEFSDEVYRMPVEVMWACCLLDRTRAPSHAYYARIARNPLALCVKLADIADNEDESRLSLLDDKTAARLRRKYAKARVALGVA